MADEPLKTAVLTDVGIAKLDAAYQAGTKVTIAEMALGDSNLEYVVPDPAFTQLVNEFGRQPINEGNTSDTWINAIVYVDSTQFAGKSILEFGLYDDEGDLIVYSSYTPSVIPAVGQDYIQLEIECSVDLYNASAVTIEVTPIYPQATELERGIAKIATAEDVAAGVDDEKIVTAKKLRAIQNKQKRQTLFMPVFCAGAGWTPDPDLYAPELGQKCYQSEYPTVYDIVSTQLTNVIDEDTKAASIADGSNTYVGYFGLGSDENGNYFTTRNKSLFMHDKAAGVYGSAGEFKQDHMQKITGMINGVQHKGGSGYDGALTTNLASITSSSVPDSASGSSVLIHRLDSSLVTRTDPLNYTDTMGTFVDPLICLPTGEF